jgi:hypothetical protein
MTDRVRAILVSGVLAVLIWAFAEAESLRSVDIAVDLILRASESPARTADVPGQPVGKPVRISATIEGPTGAVDAFLRRGEGRVLEVSPGMGGMPVEPGEHVVDLRQVIRATGAEFTSKGLNIKKVDPPTLRLVVDEWATREVRVEVVTPEGDLDGPPEPTPRLVRLVAPAREMAAVPEASRAVARIDAGTFGRLVPGRRETIPAVPLELPGEVVNSSRARLEPSSVSVTLTVRSRTATIVVPSVPVHLRIAPAEMAKFDVDIVEQDRAILDVTVSGPADLVRQIEDKSVPLIAMVPLSFEELERGIASKEVQFHNLPGGSLRFEAPNKTVRLKIRRRETTTPQGNPPR